MVQARPINGWWEVLLKLFLGTWPLFLTMEAWLVYSTILNNEFREAGPRWTRQDELLAQAELKEWHRTDVELKIAEVNKKLDAVLMNINELKILRSNDVLGQ